MRPFYWIILIVAQIWFACQVSLVPFNAAKVSYRRQERAAAVKAQADNPTPATRAALQEELHLAAQHVVHRQVIQAGVLLAVFLAFDLAFIYGQKYLKRESTIAYPGASPNGGPAQRVGNSGASGGPPSVS